VSVESPLQTVPQHTPASRDSITPAQRRRSLVFLSLAVGAVGFAMTLQLGLNANFVGQEMKLTGLQQGLLETFRETCGITALLVLAVLAGLPEPLIGAVMLVLLGTGLSAYAFVRTYTWLVLASLVWSQGLHVWMPLPNSMALALAEPNRSGRRLGQIAAAGSIGSAAGLAIAWLLTRAGAPIRPLWLLAGAAAIVGALCCVGVFRRIKAPGERLVFRRRYGLYYLLCFLEGWRKQIFLAFAGFMLVRRHGTPLSTMLALWMAIQVCGWLGAPIVGRLIDRFGERPMLMVYYTAMTMVFVGYAAIDIPAVLYVLFVADSAFFVFAMALTTYVNRIAPPGEHTPTLSMGVAMNHVAAVLMPLIGGLLWELAGYRWAFVVGALVAAASVGVAMLVPARAAPADAPAVG